LAVAEAKYDIAEANGASAADLAVAKKGVADGKLAVAEAKLAVAEAKYDIAEANGASAADLAVAKKGMADGKLAVAEAKYEVAEARGATPNTLEAIMEDIRFWRESVGKFLALQSKRSMYPCEKACMLRFHFHACRTKESTFST
jgi:hypothetical protein